MRENNSREDKILITGGGTKEPLDGVRSITNTSSGKTACALVETFRHLGFSPYFVHSKDSCQPEGKDIPRFSFTDFQSLDACLKSLLSRHSFKAVFHLAAVSDYSVKEIQCGGKIYLPNKHQKFSSAYPEIKVIMKSNFKILYRLRDYSLNKGILVVGFKLTLGATEEVLMEKLKPLLQPDNVDYVVCNDLEFINGKEHPYRIFSVQKGHAFLEGKNKNEMCAHLGQILYQHSMEKTSENDLIKRPLVLSKRVDV